MEYGQANNTVAGAAYRDEIPADMRPLEEIAHIADELSRVNMALDAYLGRFNGPSPAQLQTGAKAETRPPSYYRSDIDRLRATLQDISRLADAIVRLG